jgi:hypothetical protein
MKARPFLAVVLAVAVALLSSAALGWWLVWAHSPLQLQRQPLTVPMAARFVPRQAALTLTVFADGGQLESYARAAAPGRRRHQAAAAVARLRDGAFAAAGLDYSSELASWLAPETTLALLADRGGTGVSGWMLGLRSREGAGARHFLQRFWQSRSLAGGELRVGSYRGMGLISDSGLATALINDDLVLIASSREVLEQGLDVSQIEALNLASDPDVQASVPALQQGVALLTARAGALQHWLGAPDGITAMVAVVRPEGAGLALDARFSLAEPLPTASAATAAQGPALLQAFRGEADSLALLQGPGDWPDPLQRLLQPGLAAAQAGPIPALVAAAAHGPLLWSRTDQGWRLGLPARSPDSQQLVPALQAEHLLPAPLQLQGQPVEAWTRLAASGQNGDAGQLEATVVGVHTSATSTAAPQWWAQSLPALAAQFEAPQGPQSQLAALDALPASPRALLRWTLASGPARELLQAWQPWQLLAALGGEPIGSGLQGLGLSLEPLDGQLQLRARLQFT